MVRFRVTLELPDHCLLGRPRHVSGPAQQPPAGVGLSLNTQLRHVAELQHQSSQAALLLASGTACMFSHWTSLMTYLRGPSPLQTGFKGNCMYVG